MEGRIFHNKANNYLSITATHLLLPDDSMVKAFWILLDYMEKVEYHSPSSFPVQIVFLMDSEDYEIIHVPHGKEVIINRAQRNNNNNDYTAKRIVLIDDKSQVKHIKIDNTTGYCIENNGEIQYFQKPEG